MTKTNKKSTVVLSLAMLISFSVLSQNYKLGEDFDPVIYMNTPKVPPLSRGNFDNLPSSVSLLKYAPAVGNQMQSGSCVGWATSYAANSIAYRITTEKSEGRSRFPGAFSPSYVFNQIKASSDCSGGSNIERALRLLTLQGALPLPEFPYSDKTCSRLPSEDELTKAERYTIEGYRRLSSIYSQRSLHLAVRRALSKKHPVVIGMLVGSAFQKYDNRSVTFTVPAEDNALLDSLGMSEMYSREGWGGHAMAVVGYDDNRDGGAFLIMNSWGKSNWGDHGYAWVKYTDFVRWVSSAYEVVPQIPEVPEPPKPKTDFHAQVTLKGIHNKLLEQQLDKSEFRLQQPLYSRALIRAEVTVSDDSHIYIIGTDLASAKHKVLFPYKGQSSTFLNADSTMLLPGPTEDYYARLDQQQGTDYLIFLHSRQKIDIPEIANQLDKLPHLSLKQRLSKVFGDRIVSDGDTELLAPGNYGAFLGNNRVLANVVVIEHLDASFNKPDSNAPEIVITSPEVDSSEAYVDGVNSLRDVNGDEVTIEGIAQDESEIAEIDIAGAFDIKFSSRGPFIARVDLSDIAVGNTKAITVRSRDKQNNLAEKTILIRRVKL